MAEGFELQNGEDGIRVAGKWISLTDADTVYAALLIHNHHTDSLSGAVPALESADNKGWWYGNPDFVELQRLRFERYGLRNGDIAQWRAGFEDAFEKVGWGWSEEDEAFLPQPEREEVDGDEDDEESHHDVEGFYVYKADPDQHYELIVVTEENLDSVRNRTTYGIDSHIIVQPGRWIMLRTENGESLSSQWLTGDDESKEWVSQNLERVDDGEDEVADGLGQPTRPTLYRTLYRSKNASEHIYEVYLITEDNVEEMRERSQLSSDVVIPGAHLFYDGDGHWTYLQPGKEKYLADNYELVQPEESHEESSSTAHPLDGRYRRVQKDEVDESKNGEAQVTFITEENIEELETRTRATVSSAFMRPGSLLFERSGGRNTVRPERESFPSHEEYLQTAYERIDDEKSVEVGLTDAISAVKQRLRLASLEQNHSHWPKPGDFQEIDFGIESCDHTYECDDGSHYFCTRAVEHNPPHVASDGNIVVAVWDENGYFDDEIMDPNEGVKLSDFFSLPAEGAS